MKYLTLKKSLAAWQAIQPLSERDRNRLSRRFTVDFNYNSNHIEGNTLTYGQTELLLLFGKVIGEAEVRDVHEMTASNVGLQMMVDEANLKRCLCRNTSSAHSTRPFFVRITLSIAICLADNKPATSSMLDSIRRAPTASSPVMAIVLSMPHLRRRHH